MVQPPQTHPALGPKGPRYPRRLQMSAHPQVRTGTHPACQGPRHPRGPPQADDGRGTRPPSNTGTPGSRLYPGTGTPVAPRPEGRRRHHPDGQPDRGSPPPPTSRHTGTRPPTTRQPGLHLQSPRTAKHLEEQQTVAGQRLRQRTLGHLHRMSQSRNTTGTPHTKPGQHGGTDRNPTSGTPGINGQRHHPHRRIHARRENLAESPPHREKKRSRQHVQVQRGRHPGRKDGPTHQDQPGGSRMGAGEVQFNRQDQSPRPDHHHGQGKSHRSRLGPNPLEVRRHPGPGTDADPHRIPRPQGGSHNTEQAGQGQHQTESPRRSLPEIRSAKHGNNLPEPNGTIPEKEHGHIHPPPRKGKRSYARTRPTGRAPEPADRKSPRRRRLHRIRLIPPDGNTLHRVEGAGPTVRRVARENLTHLSRTTLAGYHQQKQRPLPSMGIRPWTPWKWTDTPWPPWTTRRNSTKSPDAWTTVSTATDRPAPKARPAYSQYPRTTNQWPQPNSHSETRNGNPYRPAPRATNQAPQPVINLMATVALLYNQAHQQKGERNPNSWLVDDPADNPRKPNI